jgi:anaerobic magnesium-protoporphyrin IX monomethyl ester cyclase
MRAIANREEYAFSESPPYTILKNRWLSYEDICRIETIGRLLDLFNKHGKLATAFSLLQRTMTFAHILDRMARQVGNENLSSLSCKRVFELFSRLAVPLLPEPERPFLFDALFFDYCTAEMPLMGKLPSFIAHQQEQCSWPGRKEFPKSLNIPVDGRVKSFRYTFGCDYRHEPFEPAPQVFTFVYISCAGQGLQVEVVPG